MGHLGKNGGSSPSTTKILYQQFAGFICIKFIKGGRRGGREGGREGGGEGWRR